MQYFQNESEVLSIGEFNIENRLDRVSLFGSLDVTHDAAGLELALKLKIILDGLVLVLTDEQAAGSLPDRITTNPTDEADNPFA